MSIASEISRLQGVKADILQAISDKGVTVPVGSALDDCPGLIASISGGVKTQLNISRYGLYRNQWFDTPHFNLVDCDEIEENWEFTIKDYSGDGFSTCNGQWFTGNQSFWRGIAIYISTSQISFAVGSTEHVVNQSYTTLDKVVLNIKTDINNAVAKVYYNDVLVKEFTASRNDLNLSNDMYFRVGGLRYNASEASCLSGTMNLNNCYIKLNGVLAWGVEL